MPAPDQMAATPTFRGQFPTTPAEAPRPSRREWVVTGWSGLALVLPAWMLGAWRPWSLGVTLGLALVAFAALFAPMFDYRLWPRSDKARAAWSRLVRFPVFWLGLAILIYGTVAALNPWRALTADGRVGWYEAIPYIAHLPHAMETPFEEMNAWKALLQIAPAWLVACAIWAGVGHAGLLRGLVGWVAVNGALLAGLGMLELWTGTREMFWVYDPHPMYDAATFFSSFIYAGHAAAWLTLALGAAAARLDAAWRAQPRAVLGRGVWTLVFATLLAVIGEIQRPDFWVLACGGMVAVLGAMWVGRLGRAGRKTVALLVGVPTVAFGVIMLVALFVAVWSWHAGADSTLDIKVNPRDASLPVRYAIAKESANMIAATPVWGWGPGSFRFVAPHYLRHNPWFTEPDDPQILRFSVNYAHCDWVQLVAEWGAVGASLFVGILAWWAWRVWSWRRLLPPESWLILAAVVMVLIGAIVDFPLYNPAVLVALSGLLAVTIRAAEPSVRLG